MRLLLDDAPTILSLTARRPQLIISIDEKAHGVREIPGEQGAFEIEIDGTLHRGWRYASGDEVFVRFAGRTFHVLLPRALADSAGVDAREDEIHADMPGILVAVHCAPGQDVRAGDKLVTLESMKLQLTLVAPRDGVVAQVHLPVESVFERGALLVSLQQIHVQSVP